MVEILKCHNSCVVCRRQFNSVCRPTSSPSFAVTEFWPPASELNMSPSPCNCLLTLFQNMIIDYVSNWGVVVVVLTCEYTVPRCSCLEARRGEAYWGNFKARRVAYTFNFRNTGNKRCADWLTTMKRHIATDCEYSRLSCDQIAQHNRNASIGTILSIAVQQIDMFFLILAHTPIRY